MRETSRQRRQWQGESPSLRKAERFEPDGLWGSQRVGLPVRQGGLKALQTGLEGGKWFRLIDKVWSEKHLQSALKQVLHNS